MEKKAIIDYPDKYYDLYEMGGVVAWIPESTKLLVSIGGIGYWKNYLKIVDIDKPENVTVLKKVLAMDISYSPDGKWIVFSSDMDGGNFDIFLMKADGTVIYRVTDPILDDNVTKNWRKEPRPMPPPNITATPIPTPTPRPVIPEIPGFEAIFTIIGLLAVVHLIRRKK